MRRLLTIIGPGILVAATGVGAGDLATAGFAGHRLGTAVLWVVALGAFLKFVLTEGLTRWQLATGCTILEGAVQHLRWPVSLVFGLYLLPWSYFTGAALISACGVTGHALAGWMAPAARDLDPTTAKLVIGAAHSVVAVALVWLGGYRLIERVMAACIAVMFAAVLITAILLRPDVADVAGGLVIPRIPDLRGDGLTWSIGLMGGVGGTLTILCYGYWIREEGRTTVSALSTCRIDLGVGYAMTGLFGIAMIVIASRVEGELSGRGVGLIVALADQLETAAGPWGRVVFLLGAWAAVFSSLLGVWQAVPYVFADFLDLVRGRRVTGGAVDVRGGAYRGFLLALAAVPLLQVTLPFREVQKLYVVIGAAFIPLLAAVLLLLNGRRDRLGSLVNRPLTVILLVAVLGLSGVAGWLKIRSAWFG